MIFEVRVNYFRDGQHRAAFRKVEWPVLPRVGDSFMACSDIASTTVNDIIHWPDWSNRGVPKITVGLAWPSGMSKELTEDQEAKLAAHGFKVRRRRPG